MSEKRGRARGFRPELEVQERLDDAEKCGFNVSELINKTLKRHFNDVFDEELKIKHELLMREINLRQKAAEKFVQKQREKSFNRAIDKM